MVSTRPPPTMALTAFAHPEDECESPSVRRVSPSPSTLLSERPSSKVRPIGPVEAIRGGAAKIKKRDESKATEWS